MESDFTRGGRTALHDFNFLDHVKLLKVVIFQTAVIVDTYPHSVWRRTRGSGSLQMICLRPQRPQHRFRHFYHQIQPCYLTTLPQRHMSSTPPGLLKFLESSLRRLLLAPKFGRKGRRRISRSLMSFLPSILKNPCAKSNHMGLDEAPQTSLQPYLMQYVT